MTEEKKPKWTIDDCLRLPYGMKITMHLEEKLFSKLSSETQSEIIDAFFTKPFRGYHDHVAKEAIVLAERYGHHEKSKVFCIKLSEEQEKAAEEVDLELDLKYDGDIRKHHFKQAGMLAERVGLIDRAMDMYIKGCEFKRATRLAEKLGLEDRAMDVYLKDIVYTQDKKLFEKSMKGADSMKPSLSWQEQEAFRKSIGEMLDEIKGKDSKEIDEEEEK